jgi:hypothetical protein
MKTNMYNPTTLFARNSINHSFMQRGLFFIALLFALCAMSGTAHGQTIYVTNAFTNTIGEYDATTGATINASLAARLVYTMPPQERR